MNNPNQNQTPRLRRAIIYCRVSTKEQVDEGSSLTTQEKMCREYARKNNYEIVEVFVEQGESAKTADRTQLKVMMLFAADKKNRIDVVLIYKLDRLSRNTIDYGQLRIQLKRFGVEIKSISEMFEDNPTGRFVENMIVGIAQLDNEIRAERCKGGMKEAVEQGRYVWCAPIGYVNGRIGGQANILPSEMAPMVQKAFEMVARHNYHTDEIRIMLSKEGLKLPNGKPVSKGYFYKMLRNRMYTGSIQKFGATFKGSYVPLISAETFDQVQRVLKTKGWKISEYKYDNPLFPLRRFIVNSNDIKLTGSMSEGNGGKYPYYRFPDGSDSFTKNEIETVFMNYMDKFAYDSRGIAELKKCIKESWTKRHETERKDSRELQRKVEDLVKKQGQLLEKNLSGVIGDALLKQQLEVIERDITNAKINLYALEENEIDAEEAVAYSEEFLKYPSKVWMDADLPEQTKLQWFQFPQGIVFENKKFGTKEISFVFKEKDTFMVSQSTGVDRRGLEPPTSSVQVRRSTR